MLNTTEEESIVSSLVERCQSKNEKTIQEKWQEQVTKAVDSIVEVNPYLPEVNIGNEILAINAVPLTLLTL